MKKRVIAGGLLQRRHSGKGLRRATAARTQAQTGAQL